MFTGYTKRIWVSDTFVDRDVTDLLLSLNRIKLTANLGSSVKCVDC